MSNNLNIRSQTTLRELEEELSKSNVPIVLFKELLTSIKNNDFSNLAGSISKLRYQTSEEKVKEQIDNIIYQQIYNNTDYNNLILLITKIYSIIDSLVEARMNITDVYKQDITVVEDMLESYGFDIHKIFDENAKRNIAYRIYYFLKRKGTPQLIGEFLEKLGYTHYAINEYSLNRDSMEWKFIPETIEISEPAKKWKNSLSFDEINLNDIDDALWYLDENKLNDILFKNTNLYPKDWSIVYEITKYDFLSKYLGLSSTDEVIIDSVSFSEYGQKMAIACKFYFTGWNQISDTEFEPINYRVKDGFGNILMELDDKYLSRKSIFIIDLKKEKVEQEYVMYDAKWYDYYLNWYIGNYPSWESNTEYSVGNIVIYDNNPVICKRDHISSSSFDYNQDGIETWAIYAFDYNWWVNQGYLKNCNIDENTLFTTYFENSNNIYIVPNKSHVGEFLKINILDNTVKTINISQFKNKFTDITFSDFFGEEHIENVNYSIVGKYRNYLIFGSPDVWNADNSLFIDNTFIFFDLKEKTWFSLYDSFFKYYSAESFTINVFNNSYGFDCNKIMQNKLWFTVEINNHNYLMGMNLKNIENHVDTIHSFGSDTITENVEQKENYVSNIMNNYFKISLDEFDPNNAMEFLIGRDRYIYISGTLKEDLCPDNVIFWGLGYQNVLKVYDKSGKYIKDLLNGVIISPWGMDYDNSIIMTISTNTSNKFEHDIYLSCNPEYKEHGECFPIVKLKPSLTNENKIENENMIINTINYMGPDDVSYSPWVFIFNKCPQLEVLPAASHDGGNHGIVYDNELYIFHNERYINKYNSLSDCWTDVSPPLPYGCIYVRPGQSVLYDKRVYLFSSGFFMIYDLGTREAIDIGMPYVFEDNSSFSVEIIDDKIYLFGGKTGPDTYSDKLIEYNITTSTWTEKPPCPIAKAYHSSAVYDNKLYIMGGTDASVWIYDSYNEVWEQKADFPGGADTKSHAATVIEDKIYYYFARTMWEYDPVSYTWTQKITGSTEMPNYGGYVMKTFNNKAYLFGGSIDSLSNSTNKIWEYDRILDSWIQKSSLFCNPLYV